jgi:hypothetical protein
VKKQRSENKCVKRNTKSKEKPIIIAFGRTDKKTSKQRARDINRKVGRKIFQTSTSYGFVFPCCNRVLEFSCKLQQSNKSFRKKQHWL